MAKQTQKETIESEIKVQHVIMNSYMAVQKLNYKFDTYVRANETHQFVLKEEL